jgi:hypothetical protein
MQLLDALSKLVSAASLWKCYNCCIIRELLLCFSRSLQTRERPSSYPVAEGPNPALITRGAQPRSDYPRGPNPALITRGGPTPL